MHGCGHDAHTPKLLGAAKLLNERKDNLEGSYELPVLQRVQPIPPPLLDRMEVIELPGYTPEEKLKIAIRHLIQQVLDHHGLSSEFFQIPEIDLSSHIVRAYLTLKS